MVGQEVSGAFAAYALPQGTYWLAARWLDPVGGADSLAVACEKFAPVAREVKIDLFSQSLLVNGEPFFPIGLYWLRADILAPMRRLHFNSGDYFYRLRGEEVATLMDEAAEAGMHILLGVDRVRPAATRAGLPSHCRCSRTVSAASALLAWYIVDEPGETQDGGRRLPRPYTSWFGSATRITRRIWSTTSRGYTRRMPRPAIFWP